jgi:hypothetical protein
MTSGEVPLGIVSGGINDLRVVFARSPRQCALRRADLGSYLEQHPDWGDSGESFKHKLDQQSRGRFGGFLTELGGSQNHVVNFLRSGRFGPRARKILPLN